MRAYKKQPKRWEHKEEERECVYICIYKICIYVRYEEKAAAALAPPTDTSKGTSGSPPNQKASLYHLTLQYSPSPSVNMRERENSNMKLERERGLSYPYLPYMVVILRYT